MVLLLVLVGGLGGKVIYNVVCTLAFLGSTMILPGGYGLTLILLYVVGIHNLSRQRLGGLYPPTYIFV